MLTSSKSVNVAEPVPTFNVFTSFPGCVIVAVCPPVLIIRLFAVIAPPVWLIPPKPPERIVAFPAPALADIVPVSVSPLLLLVILMLPDDEEILLMIHGTEGVLNIVSSTAGVIGEFSEVQFTNSTIDDCSNLKVLFFFYLFPLGCRGERGQ